MLDINSNIFDWINFTIQLKTNPTILKSAIKIIQLEKNINIEKPEAAHVEVGSIEHEILKLKLKNLMHQAMEIDQHSAEACDVLLSTKFVSSALRLEIMNHPLFRHVENDSEPTADEYKRYCINQPPDLPTPSEGVKTRSKSKQSNTIDSGITTKNLLLLYKIMRVCTLKISKDTLELQRLSFDRLYQHMMRKSFNEFVEIYMEMHKIMKSIDRALEGEMLVAHFLNRVDQRKHLIPLQTIYAMEKKPSIEQSIEIIKQDDLRNENRKMELNLITREHGNFHGNNGSKPNKVLYTKKKAPNPCRYCGGDHWNSDCPTKPKRFENISSEKKQLFFKVFNTVKNNIYIDSGSQVSMVNDLKLLSDVRNINLRMKLKFISGNGSILVKKVGSFLGVETYYVPEASESIISFGQLYESGIRINHKGDDVIELVDNNGVAIATCSIDNRMLVLNDENENSKKLYLVTNNKKINEYNVLGKPSFHQLDLMIKNSMISGLNLDQKELLSIKDVIASDMDRISATITNKVPKQSTNERSEYIGQKVYVDVTFDVHGNKYLFSVDRFSNFKTIQMIPSKSNVPFALEQLMIFYHGHNHDIKMIVSDCEAIFMSCQEVCLSNRTRLVHTSPGKHNQIVERAWRTVKEKSVCLRNGLEYELPKPMYPDLLQHTVLIINLYPSPNGLPTNCYEQFYSMRFDLSINKLFSFGVPLIIHSEESLGKPRSLIGLYAGWDAKVPQGHKVFIPSLRRKVYRHVVKELAEVPKYLRLKRNTFYENKLNEDDYVNNDDDDDIGVELENEQNDQLNENDDVFIEETSNNDQVVQDLDVNINYDYESNNNIESIQYDDENHDDLDYFQDPFVGMIQVEEIEAIEKELNQMMDKSVFELIDREKEIEEKNIIDSTIFVKKKFDAEGKFMKFKARLVARGDLIKYDPEETSSPTANNITINIILSLCAKNKFLLSSFDVPGAYLNADIDKELFIRIPKKVKDIWNRKFNKEKLFNETIVKLNKALYGLPESSRLWYNHIKSFLLKNDFKINEEDNCFFMLKKESQTCYVILYVDDILIVSSDEIIEEQIHSLFVKEFGGEINFRNLTFLSLMINQDMNDETIKVHQFGQIENIIEKVDREFSYYPASTPGKIGLYETRNRENEVLLNDHQRKCFHSTIMALYYVALRTRPDILKEISFLSTRCLNPTSIDYDHLKHLINYIRCNKKASIVFRHSESNQLIIQADASFGVHKDTAGHTGILIKLYDNIVMFKSSKQKIITKSSTESELVALDDAGTYGIWIYRLLMNFGIEFDVPIIFQQDNLSTIFMAEHGKTQFKRTKHINNKYYFIKQFIDDKIFKLNHCYGRDLFVDFFTKYMSKEKFVAAIKQMIVKEDDDCT